MTDEIFDRQYQAARAELNSGMLALGRRFAAAVGNAFAVLNRIEYSPPWTAGTKAMRPQRLASNSGWKSSSKKPAAAAWR